jgi:cell division septal protein FtsQ
VKRRLLIAAGAIALVVVVIGGARLLRTLSFFQVRRVELVGGNYLTVTEVTRALAIPPRYSLFDGKESLERRARRIPGVLEARISRRLPGTIRVIIREAEPVALAERNGRLVLVDGSGHVLPFDPTRPAADLPLGDPDSAVAGLLAKVRETDPALFGRIVRAVRIREDVMVDLGASRMLFRAGASSEEIRDLGLVADFLTRRGRVWRELDGRFLPRVILRGKGA